MKPNLSKLQKLLTLCQEQHIKLTPLRKAVLEILSYSEKPLSAYDVLRGIKNQHPQTEAMTVYRILNLFEQKDLIHKITAINAYAICEKPTHKHSAQLLLCDTCGHTKEINENRELELVLNNLLNGYHYKLSTKPIEILGICQNCQTS